MEREELRILLEKVESGQQTAADALSDISLQPDMLVGNYADIDLHRHMRQGMPEVIYGAGKTAEQIVGIASAMKQKGLQNILITRLSEEKADEIAKALEFSYYSTPQIGIVNEAKTEKRGKIVVVAAGTSDLPVAEEAAMTAELYGNQVERVLMLVWPASIVFCIGFRLWKTRMSLSQWQVWRGHWLVWSVVWWPVRSSVYRRVSAMAQTSADWRHCSRC